VRSPGGRENEGADATQHRAGWVAIRRALVLIHDTASVSSCFVAAVAILRNWYPQAAGDRVKHRRNGEKRGR
jgi:hypothetical protein